MKWARSRKGKWLAENLLPRQSAHRKVCDSEAASTTRVKLRRVGAIKLARVRHRLGVGLSAVELGLAKVGLSLLRSLIVQLWTTLLINNSPMASRKLIGWFTMKDCEGSRGLPNVKAGCVSMPECLRLSGTASTYEPMVPHHERWKPARLITSNE
jgi:hypothetical protein